ncbi:MAG TPA: hypothetical protein PKH58_12200 [Paludibacteraceae bacterium]|nr:hypothetical protein [Paludibacteraceae bacterium]
MSIPKALSHLLLVGGCTGMLLAAQPSSRSATLSLKFVPSGLSPHFEATLANTSKSDIKIYRTLLYGLTIELFDGSGKQIAPRVTGDLCPPAPPNPHESPFVTVHPCQSISVVYDRSIEDLGIEHAGIYYALASYNYTLTPTHKAYPSLTKHPIQSEKIKVTIP